LEDKANGLLKRRELRCLFKGYAGKLTRIQAAEMLAKELKLDGKYVIPVTLHCETGMNDVKGTFYVYDDETIARRHIPKYVFMRMMTKDERKQAKEAEKAKAKKPVGGAEGAKAEEKPKETKPEGAKAEEKPKETKPKGG
jgi:ribosomal protein S24E